MMMQISCLFPHGAKRALLSEFLRLPGALAPERMSIGEDEPGLSISSSQDVLDTLDQRTSGFFLKNKRCSYNINIVEKLPIRCSCFINLEASQAKTLLTWLAAANPLFGFACLPEERQTKNRVVNKLGINNVESWVGRDIEKALPGLYWCTLIPELLAQKHGIPLSALSAAALEHFEFDGKQHLFRFYQRPEDWRTATGIVDLSSSIPGIFDVEKARTTMAQAKTFLELVSISKQWT